MDDEMRGDVNYSERITFARGSIAQMKESDPWKYSAQIAELELECERSELELNHYHERMARAKELANAKWQEQEADQLARIHRYESGVPLGGPDIQKLMAGNYQHRAIPTASELLQRCREAGPYQRICEYLGHLRNAGLLSDIQVRELREPFPRLPADVERERKIYEDHEKLKAVRDAMLKACKDKFTALQVYNSSGREDDSLTDDRLRRAATALVAKGQLSAMWLPSAQAGGALGELLSGVQSAAKTLVNKVGIVTNDKPKQVADGRPRV